jgi:GT2 family glycosyltransferase
MLDQRSATDDIRYPGILTPDAHVQEHLIEHLPRRADKWPALFIFPGTRAFADYHQAGRRRTFPEHD